MFGRVSNRCVDYLMLLLAKRAVRVHEKNELSDLRRRRSNRSDGLHDRAGDVTDELTNELFYDTELYRWLDAWLGPRLDGWHAKLADRIEEAIGRRMGDSNGPGDGEKINDPANPIRRRLPRSDG